MNYRELEVEFFQARSLKNTERQVEISRQVSRAMHELDVRCAFYLDTYGAQLDVVDRSLPRTPVQDKYERLSLEYGEVNRLRKVIDAYGGF
jgi:hypothetical protein